MCAKVGHEADGVPAVGAALVGVEVERLVHRALDVVVDAEPALLHDDAALLLEVLRRDREVPHAIGLEVEHDGQRLAREVVQVGREVARGVAVRGAAVALDEVVEHPGADTSSPPLNIMCSNRCAMPVAPHCSLREPARKKTYDEITGVGVVLMHQQAETVRERERLDGQRDRARGTRESGRQQRRRGAGGRRTPRRWFTR